MREKDFIEVIKSVVGNKYIGDDCAYLKDLGITVTQDNLVEGVHFLREKISAYQLGWKSVAVNISDICASGAKPKYLTIGLSIPNDVDNEFIKNFYEGAKNMASSADGAKIVGGDITKSDKITISVTAIGSTRGRKISSRSRAKVGQKIVIAGEHGTSAAGLRVLFGKDLPELSQVEKDYLVNFHNMPKPQVEISAHLATLQEGSDYAMVDTSDGLADAVSQISKASEVLMEIDFDKIPVAPSVKKFENYEDLVLYGGEDYGIIATTDCVDGLHVIGEVKEGSGVKIIRNFQAEIFTSEDIEEKIFQHFKE